MKRLFKIMSLSILMVFIFVGASFAKTSKIQSQKISQSAMQEKIMREGITVKDKAGNSHYFSPKTIAANCSNAPNGKRGWWKCIKVFFQELNAEAWYWWNCDGNESIFSECAFVDIWIGAAEAYLDQNCGILGSVTLNNNKTVNDNLNGAKRVATLRRREPKLPFARSESFVKPKKVQAG